MDSSSVMGTPEPVSLTIISTAKSLGMARIFIWPFCNEVKADFISKQE